MQDIQKFFSHIEALSEKDYWYNENGFYKNGAKWWEADCEKYHPEFCPDFQDFLNTRFEGMYSFVTNQQFDLVNPSMDDILRSYIRTCPYSYEDLGGPVAIVMENGKYRLLSANDAGHVDY